MLSLWFYVFLYVLSVSLSYAVVTVALVKGRVANAFIKVDAVVTFADVANAVVVHGFGNAVLALGIANAVIVNVFLSVAPVVKGFVKTNAVLVMLLLWALLCF